MGRLELPMPEMEKDSLSWSAKDLEKRIRSQMPANWRDAVRVRPFRGGDKTGVVIEYPDEVEQMVFVAIEYPKGDSTHEDAVPHRRGR